MIQFLLSLTLASLQAQEPALDLLKTEMERVAKVAKGVVGVTAIHLETGRSVSLEPNERFPMASTVKIPLATHLLLLVDEGKLRLDQMVTLEPHDLHPGSGTLTDLFNKPGVALSIRNLMELMLLISDNSATDVLLRLAGGASAVNVRLRSLGIEGIRLDRSTALLIAEGTGFRGKLPPEEQWTIEEFTKASRGTERAAREAAIKRFQDDPQDTSTPTGMAQLLSRIARKEIHKPETAEILLDIMRRCRTGGTRLKGLLPEGTVVAHKTGTMPMVGNDVGIVTLPNNAGHLVIAVFTKKCESSTNADRAIAEVTRAAYDFFVFHPKASIDYAKLAERITTALAPRQGEKYFMRPDPGYFEALLPALHDTLRKAGAIETKNLDEAQIYLWLPLRPGGPGLPAEERARVKEWTSKGGPRRQLHFHWGEGSVLTDGLYGKHEPAFDALYQTALDIDYKELSAAQDEFVEKLRKQAVRVKTPAGTDISFRIGNRPINKQDGDASASRAEQAKMAIDRDIELPSGVVRVAPLEETVTGVIVIPQARFGAAEAKGVKLTFKAGKVIKVEAKENLGAVNEYLKAGGKAAYSFREFAIGTNPKLEHIPGTEALPYYGYGKGIVRLSLGDNEELGGNVRGGFVRWLFFPDATVQFTK